MRSPIIGITCDITIPDPAQPQRFRIYSPIAYQDAVARAGGIPLLLSPQPQLVDSYLDLLDGLILTGGDDVDVRALGGQLHPKAKVMHPRRQTFDLALLAAINRRTSPDSPPGPLDDIPTLGICLGMQLMAVHHGGIAALIQHLPDEPGQTDTTAARHTKDFPHEVRASTPTAKHTIAPGKVASWHHQAVRSNVPLGPLVVTMSADDGTVEAVEDPMRPFYLGVQWHPERTADDQLGLDIIRKLVEAAATRRSTRF